MKFFTPELISRGQSQDPETLNEVEKLWDETGDRYRAFLDSIRADLPPGLRLLEDHYYLHDAKVQGLGQRQNEFLMILQLDTPPHTLLTLTYDLLQEPVIHRAALPEKICSPAHSVTWEYEEIEPDAHNPSSWNQHILLSNGWEIQLTFRDVLVKEAQALLPVPHPGSLKTFPQSA
jgi:hypothetical protein